MFFQIFRSSFYHVICDFNLIINVFAECKLNQFNYFHVKMMFIWTFWVLLVIFSNKLFEHLDFYLVIKFSLSIEFPKLNYLLKLFSHLFRCFSNDSSLMNSIVQSTIIIWYLEKTLFLCVHSISTWSSGPDVCVYFFFVEL